MNQRPAIDISQPFTVKNAPLSPREREEILSREGAHLFEGEAGEVILAPDLGQQRLWWAFQTSEDMRREFPGMWPDIKSRIDYDSVDYVAMDLSGLPTRQWLEPLLQDADFEFFAEWMDMANQDITSAPVPEFPDGVRMRKGTDEDLPRFYEIWTAAYGDFSDGPASFDWLVELAGWMGAIEDESGEVVAFAMNSEVEGAEGRILAAAVAPEAWGHGYGELIVGAATYALAAADAVRAVVRVRPDIKQALRICAAAGYRHHRGGLEYRRTTDEEASITTKRDARRVAGVKARFGKWR